MRARNVSKPPVACVFEIEILLLIGGFDMGEKGTRPTQPPEYKK